jgi:hypothetical protein
MKIDFNVRNVNYHNAWKFFYPEGKGCPKNGYNLHHKDVTLRHSDIERYLKWLPEDLIMMTSSEHKKLHAKLYFESLTSTQRKAIMHRFCNWTGRHHSEESRKKMHEHNFNRLNGIPEITKERMRKGQTGMHFYNDGVSETRAKECPRRRMGQRKIKEMNYLSIKRCDIANRHKFSYHFMGEWLHTCLSWLL